MRISVEMSLYPLDANYAPHIHEFLDQLNAEPGISVKTNAMSTQVYGEFDLVMGTINRALKDQFEKGIPMSLVTKTLSLDREKSHWNER